MVWMEDIPLELSNLSLNAPGLPGIRARNSGAEEMETVKQDTPTGQVSSLSVVGHDDNERREKKMQANYEPGRSL